MSTQRRTVYAASSGSYSDYSVVAVFEKREDAERYVADGHAEFTEELDLYAPGYRAKTTHIYTASAWRPPVAWVDGDIAVNEHDEIDDDRSIARSHQRPQVRIYERPGGGSWGVAVRCIDRDRAIKAAADRLFAYDGTAAIVGKPRS